MEKQTQFLGKTASGVFCHPIFGSAGVFEKTAGAPAFADWDNGDQLRKFISTISKSDRQQNAYVLVNALGAGEFFGSNINADYFTWDVLSHEGDDYGYKTFLNAHAFQHHINKDPTRALGRPVLSLLNARMKRVELVVKLNREKAKVEGADGVIVRIDKGEFPDVSMGCVPKGAKILLKNGRIIPIEDIKEGFEVISHRGRAKRVVSTMTRPHSGTIFHIKPYGHRDPLILTGEHPLWIIRRKQVECRPSSKKINGGRKQHNCTPSSYIDKKGCEDCTTRPSYNFEWIRTDDVNIGDYLALPLPNFEIKKKFTEIEARLLGYYLSEGYILKNNAGDGIGVEFCTGLHEEDNHIELRNLIRLYGLESKLVERDIPERNGRYFAVWDRNFASLCQEHCGSLAKKKILSSSLMGADPKIVDQFLGTYAAGDGGLYKGAIYFSTASETLSDQLRILLARIGCIASINKIIHKPSRLVKKTTIEFQVWVGIDTAWKLTSAGIRLTENHESLRKPIKVSNKRFFYTYSNVTYLITPIEEVEKVEYDDNVYNFGVEEDDSYLIDGLVVHNCKVPYDVCYVCKHKSKTRNDYCIHMRPTEEFRDIYGPNRILPDGRRCCVLNPFARFFDISLVFIGADKTAKVMAKLASKGAYVCLGDVCSIPRLSADVHDIVGVETAVDSIEKHACACGCGDDCSGLAKLAFYLTGKSNKVASQSKVGEIIKTIPMADRSMKSISGLERLEPSIPNELLNSMAGSHDLGTCCSTTGMMGIVLKPQEFQRIILVRMGENGLADDLDRTNSTFQQSDVFDDSVMVDKGRFDTALMQTLFHLLRDRSGFGIPFNSRMVRGRIDNKKTLPTESTIDHPLLNKISAAYNGYRKGLLKKIGQAEEVIYSDPQLRDLVIGDQLMNIFMKTSGTQISILAPDSISYFVGAHLLNRDLLLDTPIDVGVASQIRGLEVPTLKMAAQKSSN